MWDLWWTKWHCDRFFSESFVFPLSISFHSIFTHTSSLIALMMEAASTSETSVNFYHTTRRCNPQDSHLHSLTHSNNNNNVCVNLRECSCSLKCRRGTEFCRLFQSCRKFARNVLLFGARTRSTFPCRIVRVDIFLFDRETPAK
jgi:DNA relaxase NicK